MERALRQDEMQAGPDFDFVIGNKAGKGVEGRRRGGRICNCEVNWTKQLQTS